MIKIDNLETRNFISYKITQFVFYKKTWRRVKKYGKLLMGRLYITVGGDMWLEYPEEDNYFSNIQQDLDHFVELQQRDNLVEERKQC